MHTPIRLSLILLTCLILPACALLQSPSQTVPGEVSLVVQTENGSTTYNQAGEVIHYVYVVTNRGEVALGEPVVISDDSKPVTCPAIPTVGNGDNVLDPGESISCIATYTVTAQDWNAGSIETRAVARVGSIESPPVEMKLNALPPIPVTAHTSTPRLSLTESGDTSTNTPEATATNALGLEATAIQSLPKANFEYIVPLTLKLNETFQVELHMSRSATGSQLATEIVTARALATSTAGTGTLVAPEGPDVLLGSGQVEVTPFMLAELTPENQGAFEIRALHNNPVQVVDEQTDGKWLWLITAKQEGRQKLIFVISQQAKSNDEAHWHTLETERREVQVNVTFGQRLGALDWKWILGILVTALLIPAFWRYVDGRRKAAESKGTSLPASPRPKRATKRKSKE